MFRIHSSSAVPSLHYIFFFFDTSFLLQSCSSRSILSIGDFSPNSRVWETIDMVGFVSCLHRTFTVGASDQGGRDFEELVLKGLKPPYKSRGQCRIAPMLSRSAVEYLM